MRTERVFAGYLALQAVMGIVWWVLLLTVDPVRSWFELMPGRREVTDAFVFADVLIVVVGSAVGAWGLWHLRRWTVIVLAITVGGVIYPTLYLIGWVSFAGTGRGCLTVMVPVSILTSWITWQAWRLLR